MSVCVCASVCGKVFEELQMGNKWGRVVSGSVWRMGVFDLEANSAMSPQEQKNTNPQGA